MNIKRGFTLIELLAVIVILAIIAVIATPIVLNIIEDTKINSVKVSANMYSKAVKLYILNEELNEIEISPGTYPITEDGDICIGIIENNICNGEKIKIEVKGSKPNSGKVKITENSIQIDYLEINGYVYYKEKDKYIIKKGKEEFTESNNGVITLDSSKIPYLTNYRIYGNSYQGVGSGKNLFNINLYSIDSEGNIMVSAENLRIGQTYTISSEKPFIWLKISDRATGYNSVQKRDFGGMTTFTFTMDRNENISEAATQYIFISFDFSVTTEFSKNINELKEAKIQIEEGTEATEYEPYGITPSLEVPSEIKSVGDLVTEEGSEKEKYEIPIKVTGKNLLDVNDFIQTYENYFHASEKKTNNYRI